MFSKAAARVPAQSHLYGDRQINGFKHSAHHRHRAVDVAHQASTTASAVDLGHGATHVDIDGFVAMVFQPARGLHQMNRLATKDLHRQRTIFQASLHKIHRLGSFGPQHGCQHEVCRCQAQTTRAAQDQSKRQLCVASERSEEESRREQSSADCDGRSCQLFDGHLAGRRI